MKITASQTAIESLDRFDVLCLWTFLALSHSKLNFLAFD